MEPFLGKKDLVDYQQEYQRLQKELLNNRKKEDDRVKKYYSKQQQKKKKESTDSNEEFGKSNTYVGHILINETDEEHERNTKNPELYPTLPKVEEGPPPGMYGVTRHHYVNSSVKHILDLEQKIQLDKMKQMSAIKKEPEPEEHTFPEDEHFGGIVIYKKQSKKNKKK